MGGRGRYGTSRRMASAGEAVRTRRRGPTFADDDRGQLLILTGVLLVLGFVTIGSTLVQIQTLEDTTKRHERDNLLDNFEEMVTKFNQTLVDGSFLGETDVQQFKDFAERAEDQLRDSATKRGIYLTVSLDEDPDDDIFQRTSRCYAFQDETDGVIRSYEFNSRDETIVGAVYDIYASDGTQTISTKYYVKLYDCITSPAKTWVDSHEVHVGSTLRFDNATQEGDDPRAMTVKEVYVEGIPQTSELIPINVEPGAPWSYHAGDLLEDDGDEMSRPISGSGKGVRSNVDLSTIDPDATITGVQINVTARGTDIVDDGMNLTGFLNGKKVGPYPITISPLDGTEWTTRVVVPTNPYGNATWTYEELRDTTWQIDYVKVLTKDNTAVLYVDEVDNWITWSLDRHDMEVDFEFDAIPDLFTSHYVQGVYRMPDQNTTGEQFYFQAYDPTAGTWRTVHTIEYNPDEDWHDFSEVLLGDEYPEDGNKRPLFRIVDSDSGDSDRVADADLDYIEFDYVRVNSVYVSP